MTDFLIKKWTLAPAPYDQAPVHVHTASDEGFAVLAGRLDVLVGADRHRLAAGDAIVVPAGTAHTFATVGEDPVTMLAILTPEVDALVAALHEAASEEQREAVWARFRSHRV